MRSFISDDAATSPLLQRAATRRGPFLAATLTASRHRHSVDSVFAVTSVRQSSKARRAVCNLSRSSCSAPARPPACVRLQQLEALSSAAAAAADRRQSCVANLPVDTPLRVDCRALCRLSFGSVTF